MNEKLKAKIESGEMPSVGTYTVLLIVGFLTGIIWGLLSLSPYSTMKKAIKSGNIEQAWESADDIRIFACIGIAINVIAVVIRVFL